MHSYWACNRDVVRKRNKDGVKTIARCKARIIQYRDGAKIYKGTHTCYELEHPTPDAKKFRSEVFKAFETPGIGKEGFSVYKKHADK